MPEKHSILFLGIHRPGRSPSQRFRMEQYMNHFREQFECRQMWLLDERDDRAFYSPGNYPGKARVLALSVARAFGQVIASGKFDIVFIQREMIYLGTDIFERLVKKLSPARIIFDFDDAIWLPNISEGNKKLAFLKNPEKTRKIIRLADMVFAGNEYLATYARQFNENVKVVPTTLDTDYHVPLIKSAGASPFRGPGGSEGTPTGKIVASRISQVSIGWSGSHTTIEHFRLIVPVLEKIREKYGDRVQFSLIGDPNLRIPSLGLEGKPWCQETEVEDLNTFDIGLMPLPDDEWSRGKCGFKGLSYMACAIPTLMSPVGVNSEIIQDGENGYLAATEAEWMEKISRLVEDPGLRKKLGEAGRKTVEEKYSVNSWKNKYVEYFEELLNADVSVKV